MTDQELSDRIREAHEREARHPHRVAEEDYAGELTCACGRVFSYRTRGLALRYYRAHREAAAREVVLVSESNLDDPCCFRRDEVLRGAPVEVERAIVRWAAQYARIGARLIAYAADEVQPALTNGHVRLVSEGAVR